MRDRRHGTIGDRKRQDMIGERQEMRGKRQEARGARQFKQQQEPIKVILFDINLIVGYIGSIVVCSLSIIYLFAQLFLFSSIHYLADENSTSSTCYKLISRTTSQ